MFPSGLGLLVEQASRSIGMLSPGPPSESFYAGCLKDTWSELQRLLGLSATELDDEVSRLHATACERVSATNKSFKKYRRKVRRRIEMIEAAELPLGAEGLRQTLIARCRRELKWYKPEQMPPRLTGKQYRRLRARQLRREIERLCGRMVDAGNHEAQYAADRQLVDEVKRVLAAADATWPRKKKKRKKQKKG